MLGKLSLLVVVCQIVTFAYGGVLPTSRLSEEEACADMYVNCTVNEDCCGYMRCLDFGNGNECRYGTDNPQVIEVGNAVQPPVDLIENLGCSLYAQSCETLLDCCAPYVCNADRTCGEPEVDPYGLGGYGGYGGYGGFPGK